MDAICFVLGLSAKSLRGDNLKDLIWGPSSGDHSAAKAAKTASVALVYTCDDGEVEGVEAGGELVFKRRITSGGSSVFEVDGAGASAEEYRKALERINVFTEVH